MADKARAEGAVVGVSLVHCGTGPVPVVVATNA